MRCFCCLLQGCKLVTLPKCLRAGTSPGPRLKISHNSHRDLWCWKNANTSYTSQGSFQIELSYHIITPTQINAKMMKLEKTCFLKRLQIWKYCLFLLVVEREKEGALGTEIFSQGAAGETSWCFTEVESSLRNGLCWTKTQKKKKKSSNKAIQRTIKTHQCLWLLHGLSSLWQHPAWLSAFVSGHFTNYVIQLFQVNSWNFLPLICTGTSQGQCFPPFS